MSQQDLLAQPFGGYCLHDSGDGAKLESIGGHLVQRPCPQAIWPRRLAAQRWQEAASICHRSKDGGGRWEHRQGEPATLWASWQGDMEPCRFALRFTGFGHCGMFPEQAPVWQWLQQRIQSLRSGGVARPRIANCFAYSGCGSVALAAAGAEVFHVDSAKGILAWAEENYAANPHCPGSVRCVHEDTRAFLRFAHKRGFRYHGIVLDPPAWGHGKGKETWLIERDLMELLQLAVGALSDGGFIHLGCHAPGVQRAALVNALSAVASWQDGASGEYHIAHDGDSRQLPAGVYAWAAGASGPMVGS